MLTMQCDKELSRAVVDSSGGMTPQMKGWLSKDCAIIQFHHADSVWCSSGWSRHYSFPTRNRHY